ncbi:MULTISPECIES: rhomboid family intramembrane serine protease [unclassified Myroides]|uniref:rhomboid family intramembrane serine protease n=1 Tax=unclassified Myroides TaxID=2642485 RepID=UPI003D2F7412
MRLTEGVKQLLIINILFFVGSMLVPATYDYLAMYYFGNAKFQFWQPLSYMFMHGGMMHIFFNMFALFSFGSTLEMIFGTKRLYALFLISGFGAALLHMGVNYYSVSHGVNQLIAAGYQEGEIYSLLKKGMYNTGWESVLGSGDLRAMIAAFNTPVVGASGAVYGFLVAFAYMFPNAELMMMFIPVPIKAKYFVPGILAIDLIGGLTGGFSIFGGGTGIAHFAHVGGALTGFLLVRYWKKNQFNQNRWDL